MAIMGKPVWAVVCGAIRQSFDLYATLASLCEYRSKGLIEGIVISTWKGEADNFPNLREKLATLNIYVVEADPLDEDLGKFCDLNYARQAYQLKNGLDFVPEDVFVIKCRTDVNDNLLQYIAEQILQKNVDLSIGQHGAWHSNLQYRIAIAKFPLIPILSLCDTVFMGYKSDLYKMVSFDNVVAKYGYTIPPEIAFFYNLFIYEYPIFRDILQFSNKSKLFSGGREIVHRLKNNYPQNIQNKQNFELPGIFNKLFALYFLFLKNCFYFYPLGLVKKAVQPFYLSDVFTGNTQLGIKTPSSRDILLTNKEILHMIIDGRCIPTNGYMKFFQEINRLKEPQYAERMYITKKDYQETVLWIKDILHLNPDKVITWIDPAPVHQNTADFSAALDILYADQTFLPQKAESFHRIMRNICFPGNISFYLAIKNNLEYLKLIDIDLFENAVAASARTLLPCHLKFIAKSLYTKEVSASRENDYIFIFKRYIIIPTPRLYRIPVHADMFAALYYYSKYAEEYGEIFEGKRLYTFLLKYTDTTDRPEPDSYADAALALLKEIVSRRCSEYQDNLEIRYMIDFLFDEFGESAFSPDTTEQLGPYMAERKYGQPFSLGQSDAYAQLLRGAQTARKNEVNCILRFLLREMSNQPESVRKKAQQAITDLTRRFAVPESCLLRAGTLNNGASIHIDAGEITSEEDFVLLLRLLYMHRCIAKNHADLMKICGDDKFRWFVLSFFERLEKTPTIQFFSIKAVSQTSELWINYKKFIDTGYDKNLLPVHNGQWIAWPFAETPSLSSFAAYLRMDQPHNRLICSIEFAAEKNQEKEELIKHIQSICPVTLDVANRILRLKLKNYPLDALENISSAVNHALDDFCALGDQLTMCAQKLQQSPKGNID